MTLIAEFFERDRRFTQRLLASAGFYTEKIDGIFGPATGAALNEWFKAVAELKTKYQTIYDDRTEDCILTLHPSAQDKARTLLATFPMYDIRIISGTRSYQEQDALYAQGRTAKGPKVTNARGGQSNHNFGIAFDIGIFEKGKYLPDYPLYGEVGAAAPAMGLEWGGLWSSFPDRAHFQLHLTKKLSMAEIRKRFEEGKGWGDLLPAG